MNCSPKVTLYLWFDCNAFRCLRLNIKRKWFELWCIPTCHLVPAQNTLTVEKLFEQVQSRHLDHRLPDVVAVNFVHLLRIKIKLKDGGFWGPTQETSSKSFGSGWNDGPECETSQISNENFMDLFSYHNLTTKTFLWYGSSKTDLRLNSSCLRHSLWWSPALFTARGIFEGSCDEH